MRYFKLAYPTLLHSEYESWFNNRNSRMVRVKREVQIYMGFKRKSSDIHMIQKPSFDVGWIHHDLLESIGCDLVYDGILRLMQEVNIEVANNEAGFFPLYQAPKISKKICVICSLGSINIDQVKVFAGYL